MSDFASRLITPIPELLSTLIPGGIRREGRNLVCRVPWRHDCNPSLKVHVEDGRWRDWATGSGGGLLALVQRVRRLESEGAAARWLEDQGHLRPDPSRHTAPIPRPSQPPPEPAPEEPPFIFDDRVDPGEPARPIPEGGDALDAWAALRGFTRDALLAIGARSSGALVEIPMRRPDGRVVGWRLRRADGKPLRGKAKAFTNSGGFLGLMGNSPLPQGGPLLVCEGETDGLAVLSAWPEAAVLALPGASPGEDVLRMLAELAAGREAVLVFDNDKAGERGAREALTEVPHARVGVVPPGFKDLDEHLRAIADPTARLAALEKIVSEARTQTTNSAKPTCYSIEELMRNPPAPIEWLIPEFLPTTGLYILAGPPKVGKSFLALSLCWAAASGGYLFGTKSLQAKKARVLAYFLEDSKTRFYSRLLQMRDQLQENECPSMLISHEAPKINDGLEVAILSALGERKDGESAFIIIDHLALVQTVDAGRANAYRADTQEIGALQQIAHRNKLCILALTHTRKAPPKGGDSDPIASVTGTTGISAAADGIFSLQRKAENSTGKLVVIGRECAERAFNLKFEAGQWLVGEPQPPPETDAELVSLFGDRVSFVTGDAAEALGISHEAARKRLGRASKRGSLESLGNGLFRVVGAERCP